MTTTLLRRPCFTRRHYEALAAALCASKATPKACNYLADALAIDNPYFDRRRFVAVSLVRPWKARRYNQSLYDHKTGSPRECDGCGRMQGRARPGEPYEYGRGLRRLSKPRKGPSGPLLYVCRRCDPENSSCGSPYP